MSFADTLARLRTAVLGHRGMRRDKTVVFTRDLADLINHFDGLDRSMRLNYPLPEEHPDAHLRRRVAVWRANLHQAGAGSMHAMWDVIGAAEDILASRKSIITREQALAYLNRDPR